MGGLGLVRKIKHKECKVAILLGHKVILRVSFFFVELLASIPSCKCLTKSSTHNQSHEFWVKRIQFE